MQLVAHVGTWATRLEHGLPPHEGAPVTMAARGSTARAQPAAARTRLATVGVVDSIVVVALTLVTLLTLERM